MAREITLTRGFCTVIDDGDYELLRRHRWTASGAKGKGVYAVAQIDGEPVRLHRLLLSAPVGMVVDHVSGDTLDNRRANLRLCTQRQNLLNRRSRVRPGFKGVYPCGKKWVGRVQLDGKTYTSGVRGTKLEAARAYDILALKHHGEFASLNFDRHRDWLFPENYRGHWPPPTPVAQDARGRS